MPKLNRAAMPERSTPSTLEPHTREYRSILVPVDGSVEASRALEHAVAIASCRRSWLTLLHVIEPIPPTRVFGASFGAPVLAPETEDEAGLMLERAAAVVPEGIPIHTTIRRGLAANEILNRIRAAEHDLVVLGSRGRGALRSVLFGSVSRVVRGRSPVPVIVVRCDSRSRRSRAAASHDVVAAETSSAIAR